MKATISQNKEIKYPCLMISDDSQTIILFDKFESGMVVSYSEHHKLGCYADDWDMKVFKPFTGTITLQNDI